MKKLFGICLIALAVACGSNEDKSAPSTEVKKETNDLSANPDYQKGLALIGANDCLTCHKVNEASTGPAYADIAAKYAGADDAKIKEVAGKIIAGGSGVWGQVPMTPHPALAEDDAIAMVKYVLLLKKS